MKYTTRNNSHNLTFRLFPVLILCFVILVISGCTKGLLDDSKNYKLDKEIYFTLTAGTDTYTTYGYSYHKNGTTYEGPEITITRDADSSTPAQTDLFLAVSEAIIDGYDNSIIFAMGDAHAGWFMSKPGFDITGTYDILDGPDDFNIFRNLNRTKEYYVSKQGLSFTIVNEGFLHNRLTLTGTFTCNLLLKSNTAISIPATGSFNVYQK